VRRAAPRRTLAALLAVLTLGTVLSRGTPPPQGAPPLRDLATARGLLLGAAVSGTLFDPLDPDYARLVRTEFNTVVAENAMKWASLESNRGQFVFGLADAILERARQNRQVLRGHTLLWHDSTAPYLRTIRRRDDMLDAIHTHVTGVVRHFAGRVPIWDVVNEAVSDAPGHPLRSSPFLDVAGPGYIDRAFRWAHEADPAAKLFYNDYGAEALGGKSDAVYALVKGLLARGVPIHGVGFQTHVDTNFSPRDARMAENLQRFRALGLDVELTEVDVQFTGSGSEDVQLARQAQVYADLMRTCLQVHCGAFVLWGVTDLTSWRAAGRPLIFDENADRKPAYAALARALQEVPPLP